MTTPDDLTAASEALLIDDLALRFAKRRTGGNVYMDGRHNPLPSEVIEAREVVALVARHVRETGCDGLREALLGLLEHHADVSCISTDADPWPEVCDEADERARAALGDRPVSGHPLTEASDALLADVIELLDEARRELGVWVDRDRAHNPGWTEVGYEPWANKPSLALWDVEADGLSRGLYQRLRAIEDAARAPLLDVIEGLLAQHAGWAETDPPGLSADRLSANERAFEALGWDDPHPMPDLACDEPGCLRRADCGWPSDAGYRWTCGGHMRAGDLP